MSGLSILPVLFHSSHARPRLSCKQINATRWARMLRHPSLFFSFSRLLAMPVPDKALFTALAECCT